MLKRRTKYLGIVQKNDKTFIFLTIHFNLGHFSLTTRTYLVNKISLKQQILPRHRRRNNLVHEVGRYSDKNWYIKSELLSFSLSIADSFRLKTAFVFFLSKLDDTFFPCGNIDCRKIFVSNFLTLCVVPKLSIGKRVPLAFLADLGYEKKVLRAETRFATLESYQKKYKKVNFL